MRHHASDFVFIASLSWPVTAILFPNVTRVTKLEFPMYQCTEEELHGKDLDIVLYGVDGFIGRLAANYLASGLPEAPRWAIAGRSKLKVDYIKSTLGTTSSDVESFSVSFQNQAKLVEMTKRAKAVVNFAGPFERSEGEALIRAALSNCAHYVDISTETRWKATILKKYGKIADLRGLAIVQSAGFASLASDFLAMSALVDLVKFQHDKPTDVMVVWTKFNDGVSGGQIAANHYEMMHHPPLLDAYILAPTTEQNQKVDWKIDGMTKFGNHDGVGFLSQFSLAPIDCPVIRRSIKTKFPHASISVKEAANASMFVQRRAFINNQSLLLDDAVPTNPNPGDGPPLWVQRRGSFAGIAIASGNLKKTRVTLEGYGDPSFMGSATMATEVAVGLALHGPDKKKGGYLTPALALGIKNLELRLGAARDRHFTTVTHEM